MQSEENERQGIVYIHFRFSEFFLSRACVSKVSQKRTGNPCPMALTFVYVISVNMRWRGALGRFHEHARQFEAYKIHGPIIQSK